MPYFLDSILLFISTNKETSVRPRNKLGMKCVPIFACRGNVKYLIVNEGLLIKSNEKVNVLFQILGNLCWWRPVTFNL